MPERRKWVVAMATSLEISERGPDRSSAPKKAKMLSFGEKIAKIGPLFSEKSLKKNKLEMRGRA